ncbi:MAG: SDR family oxidoreductase, partial [Pseudomonadota bacterium]
GLLEMSRQRRRSGIVDGTTSTCPTCSGSGAVRSHEMAALRIIRAIEAEAISNRAAVIAAKTSMEVALYILNHKRNWLNRIEEQYALNIEITSDPAKAGDLYDIERRGAPRAMPARPAAIQADYGVEDEEAETAHTDDVVSDEDNAERETEDRDEGDGRKRRRRRRRRRGGRDGQDRTDRADALDGGVVKTLGITLDEARAQRAATIPAGRYGTREEFGAACAFLCSTHAGFIVGQNLLLDGGATVATI